MSSKTIGRDMVVMRRLKIMLGMKKWAGGCFAALML